MPYDIWGFFIWNLRFFKNTSSSWGKQRSILSWWFLKNFKCWFEIFDDVRLLKVKAQNFTLHFLNLFIYFALHEFSINNFLEFKSVICSPWITSCSLLSSIDVKTQNRRNLNKWFRDTYNSIFTFLNLIAQRFLPSLFKEIYFSFLYV